MDDHRAAFLKQIEAVGDEELTAHVRRRDQDPNVSYLCFTVNIDPSLPRAENIKRIHAAIEDAKQNPKPVDLHQGRNKRYYVKKKADGSMHVDVVSDGIPCFSVRHFISSLIVAVSLRR